MTFMVPALIKIRITETDSKVTVDRDRNQSNKSKYCVDDECFFLKLIELYLFEVFTFVLVVRLFRQCLIGKYWAVFWVIFYLLIETFSLR